MKKFSVAIVLFIALLNVQAQTAFDLPATDFNAKMKELAKAPVIDVRTPGEFAQGYLKNAININISDPTFFEQMAKYDKNKPIFLYCLSGSRSNYAAVKMREMGYAKVYNLLGGIIKWRAAGLPEQTGNNIQAGMNKAEYDKIINTDKPVLVNFYAEWCAPCKKMGPYMDELKNEKSSELNIVRLDADATKELCKELKVETIPTVLYYKKGKLLWQQSGYISKDDLLKKL